MAYKLITIAVACALSLQATGVRADTVSLIQAGDAAISCDALASEINALAAAQEKAGKRSRARKSLFGFAQSALSVAAPLLSGGLVGGDIAGYATRGAVGALQEASALAASAQLNDTSPASTAPSDNVPAQRQSHLADLHKSKGC